MYCYSNNTLVPSTMSGVYRMICSGNFFMMLLINALTLSGEAIDHSFILIGFTLHFVLGSNLYSAAHKSNINLVEIRFPK